MSEPRATIRALPEHLINQIAAGEVIERPASAVKELVENSLDAGATRIAVEVSNGGIDLIAVSDNGHGIASEQFGYALQRHYTSKLSDASELDAIVMLGFRGEALASISAVADVAITSRRADDGHAWSLALEAGAQPTAPVPAQGNLGTRIEVRRLFSKIPARRRFLKQPRTEYLHVLRLLRQFAFARPEIHFSLVHDGGRALQLPPASYREASPRWTRLFGQAFADGARPLELSVEDIGVSGWLGDPSLASNLAETQFVCLNGRVIRDRQLAHAIRLAYEDTIPPGRFPAYALALELPFAAVDVNVHPGKLEVRFADIRAIHDLVHLAAKQALTATTAPASFATRGDERASVERVNSPPASYRSTPTTHAQPSTQVTTHQSYLGQALALVGDYLICAHQGKVKFIDLRKTWFEVLCQRLQLESAGRPLLLPERLPLPASNSRLARELSEHAGLAKIGFEIAQLGPDRAVLRAVPKCLPAVNYAEFAKQLVGLLNADEEPLKAAAKAASLALELARGSDTIVPARAHLDSLAQSLSAVEFDLTPHFGIVDPQMLAAAIEPMRASR